jgi:predicted glycogen debranching enzyme
MKEILFTKKELLNLEFSLNREILRANMSNAYASTTLCGCNTRKYHGLLIEPQPKIDNENHVLLSSLDETVVQNNTEFHLAIHCYKDNCFYPKGHKYLESYYLKNLPITTYRIGDICLTKEIQIQQRRDRLLIKYTLKEASKPITLQLQPLLAFRQIHKLSHKNDNANTSYQEVDNGVMYQMYPNYTPLYIQFSKKVKYNHCPDWYYNFEYIRERERGYDYLEDLLMMGVFSIDMAPGETFYLSCGIEEGNPFLLSQDFKRESKIRFEINSMEDVLKRAARMFFCRRGGVDVDVVAGFLWFGRWGRDTFISLPGLCIAIDDMHIFLSVIDTMLKDFKDGLFPNLGHGTEASYNSADSPLWFFWALQQYAYINDDKKHIWKKYNKVMQSILDNFEQGGFNIRMDSNYLLYQGQEGKALTWMDTIVNGVPVTQRKGYAVEINCLWYNAVMFYLELAKENCDDSAIQHWRDFTINFPINFKETFWSKEKGYLADCVDGSYKDFSIRPNMIFATSFEYSPISAKIRQLIVEKVKKELLSPRGLRTLSPTDARYKGHYYGNQDERDRAYHNGTIWPWLIGAFSEGYLRIYGKEGVGFIKELYDGFESALCEYCVGSIAEVYDGDFPYKAGGCISQAWSVAEVVRMKYLIDKYSKDDK